MRNMEHTSPPRAVSVVLNVTEDGRVIISAQALAELGVETRGNISATIVEGELVLDTIAAAVKRAQDALAPFIAEEPSVVDELIAERRVDAERE
jgi:uncharacterized protein YqgV (UPF0045/DUF77 family)